MSLNSRVPRCRNTRAVPDVPLITNVRSRLAAEQNVFDGALHSPPSTPIGYETGALWRRACKRANERRIDKSNVERNNNSSSRCKKQAGGTASYYLRAKGSDYAGRKWRVARGRPSVCRSTRQTIKSEARFAWNQSRVASVVMASCGRVSERASVRITTMQQPAWSSVP